MDAACVGQGTAEWSLCGACAVASTVALRCQVPCSGLYPPGLQGGRVRVAGLWFWLPLAKGPPPGSRCTGGQPAWNPERNFLRGVREWIETALKEGNAVIGMGENHEHHRANMLAQLRSWWWRTVVA